MLKLCPLLKLQLNSQHQGLYWSWTHLYTRPIPPPFLGGVEPILPITLVRESDHEWLVVRISRKHVNHSNKFFTSVRCIHTHTCDVCKKSWKISVQLNDPLHTPQVCGHPPQHVYWCVLINTAGILRTIALQTFTLMHSTSNMLFASRTTFSLLQHIILSVDQYTRYDQ